MILSQAQTLLTNKTSDLSNIYSKIASNQAANIQQKKLDEYQNKCNIQKDLTKDELAKISSQNNGINTPTASAQAQDVINKSTTSLSADKDNSISEFFDDIGLMFLYITNDFTTAISTFMEDFPEFLDDLASQISDAVSNFVSQMADLAIAIKDAFVKAITDMFNAAVAYINALISKLNALVNKIIEDAKKIKETAYNFYQRAKGQSSTSKYIQTNVPDTKGTLKPNNSALEGTPDKVIVEPKLKTETNSVTTMVPNPLAALLGKVCSLIPAKKIVKIEEPKPSSEKNVYGQTQVQEDKGGNTSITTTTPGNVTKTVIHPSGSSDRILNDGSKINKVVADKTDITEGNWNVTTSEDKIEIIVGDYKLEIRSNNIISINDNNDITIGGDNNEVVLGDVNTDYKSNKTEKIKNDLTEYIGGNKSDFTELDENSRVNGSSRKTVAEAFTILVGGNANIISGGTVTVTGKGGVNLKGSSGSMRIN